jgi:hypothetical protein
MVLRTVLPISSIMDTHNLHEPTKLIRDLSIFAVSNPVRSPVLQPGMPTMLIGFGAVLKCSGRNVVVLDGIIPLHNPI